MISVLPGLAGVERGLIATLIEDWKIDFAGECYKGKYITIAMFKQDF